MLCHSVFMPVMAMPLWLTQNNWLTSTKQSKVYIAAARVPIPIQFQLCRTKAERVRTRISLKFEYNIGPCVSPTTKLSYKNVSCCFRNISICVASLDITTN